MHRPTMPAAQSSEITALTDYQTALIDLAYCHRYTPWRSKGRVGAVVVTCGIAGFRTIDLCYYD
jgi:hypothetical protein